MDRLLDERELAELSACPGFDPALVHELRARRRKIYAAYLEEMAEDFRRVESIAIRYAANDPSSDPLFLERILRAKYRFLASFWWMKITLALPFRWPIQQAGGWVRGQLAGFSEILLH